MINYQSNLHEINQSSMPEREIKQNSLRIVIRSCTVDRGNNQGEYQGAQGSEGLVKSELSVFINHMLSFRGV